MRIAENALHFFEPNSVLVRLRLFFRSSQRTVAYLDNIYIRESWQGCGTEAAPFGTRATEGAPKKVVVMRPCVLICAPRSPESDH